MPEDNVEFQRKTFKFPCFEKQYFTTRSCLGAEGNFLQIYAANKMLIPVP